MARSGRSIVSPPSNPSSACQTLPEESLTGEVDPALIRISLVAAAGAGAGSDGATDDCVAAGAMGASEWGFVWQPPAKASMAAMAQKPKVCKRIFFIFWVVVL